MSEVLDKKTNRRSMIKWTGALAATAVVGIGAAGNGRLTSCLKVKGIKVALKDAIADGDSTIITVDAAAIRTGITVGYGKSVYCGIVPYLKA